MIILTYGLLLTTSLSSDPFSFDVTDEFEKVTCPDPNFFTASDGKKIAYYEFAAKNPKAKTIILHGGGAYSCAGYHYLARGLAEKGISVFSMDIRGHGLSEGKRGHTNSIIQPFIDLTQFITIVDQEKRIPLILLGHSSGAGFLLNYASYSENKNPYKYLLVAPEFGYKGDTSRETNHPFAEAKFWVFILSAFTGGNILTDYPAVHFNYPESIRTNYPLLLTDISRNMAITLTPENPLDQLKSISSQSSILIGSEDEVIDSDRLKAFGKKAGSKVEVLSGVTHLSILTEVNTIAKEIL